MSIKDELEEKAGEIQRELSRWANESLPLKPGDYLKFTLELVRQPVVRGSVAITPGELEYVGPDVREEDWPLLVSVTSDLKPEGAKEIVPFLRKRNNRPATMGYSPIPTHPYQWRKVYLAVNRAFRKADLPYRLRKHKIRKPEAEFKKVLICLWRIKKED